MSLYYLDAIPSTIYVEPVQPTDDAQWITMALLRCRQVVSTDRATVVDWDLSFVDESSVEGPGECRVRFGDWGSHARQSVEIPPSGDGGYSKRQD